MTVNPFKILFAIDRLLVKLETFLLVTALVLLLCFAFLQVMLRNVFDTAIHWGDVFNRLLVIWIGFFAATIGAHENKHLSMEVFTKVMPERAKPIISLFVNIFIIFVAAILTHVSCQFFQDQITFEATDLLFEGVPKAYFTIIFPIGFGLICFHYVVKLLENLYNFAGGDKAYPKSDVSSDIELSVKIKMK